MGLGWNNASVVAPDLVQQPRIPSDVVSMFGSSKSPVLAIDFSYRFLDLGFKGEFEYFDGLKEWTPPHVSGLIPCTCISVLVSARWRTRDCRGGNHADHPLGLSAACHEQNVIETSRGDVLGPSSRPFSPTFFDR